ncbi:MAG: polysaccharide biosynthesis/export family protein [Candidatus Krumholzibacteriia bacterium]
MANERPQTWAVVAGIVALAWFGAGIVRAQDAAAYRLGIGDQVQLSVLQQADLDRALVVRPDGTLIVPLVGAVPVAGLTTGDAEDLIRQKLRLFNREISDVSLTVTQYNALKIAVLGAVTNAGEYTFQSPPGLWEVLRAAGGALSTANLAAVRVVRVEGGQASARVYDISAIMSGQGSVDPAVLQAGDSVVVPTREETAAAPTASAVQVIGGVVRPGSLPLSEPLPLVSVLLLAGGPVEAGDVSSIWWVHGERGGRNQATRVDMNDFFKRGRDKGNPLVHPGDTVRVPYAGQGFFRSVWPILLSTATVATAVLLATNRN